MIGSRDGLRQMVVYSIGHSSLDSERFVSDLERFEVSCLADVRRFPQSRRHPHFGREALSRTLAEAGIEYVHLGDELGGFRQGSYETHTRSDAFAAGLDRLMSLGRERTTAFMCAEKFPWHCHRKFIAEALEAAGWTVRHIADGQLLL